jgi:L-asparaginase II
VAVVDRDGRLVAAAGDFERLTTLRSTAKPLQAMAMLETGAFDRYSGTPAELALIAGSHSGEPRHTEAVAGMLHRAGLGPDALQTGVHPPFDEVARSQLEARGERPNALHHNCSGKHTGMLWACCHREWDERTYVRPDHPLQRRIRSLIGVLADWPAEEIPLGIDGCTVPTFALPLVSLARTFARFTAGSGMSETHAVAAGRVRGAILEHPEMVGGTGRFDTDLMRAAAQGVVSKAGAEGGHVFGVLEAGCGIAIKIEDGGSRAAAVAGVEVLRQLELLPAAAVDALQGHARPLVRDFRGEVVGEGHPMLKLRRA